MPLQGSRYHPHPILWCGVESLRPIHIAALREAVDGHMGKGLARLLIEALRESSPDLNPFALHDQTLSALNTHPEIH